MENNIKLKLLNVEFSKSRFKTYFGNIGEMIAEEVLLKEGYSVWELRPYACGNPPSESKIGKSLFSYLDYLYKEKPKKSKLRTEYRALYYKLDPVKFPVPSWDDFYRDSVENYKEKINGLKSFFGSKLNDFKKYVESLGIIGKIGIVGAAQISRKCSESKHVYTPDLVAKKNNEIYIVEVKTNSGNVYQRKEKLKGLLSARKFNLIPLLINLNIRLEATDFIMKDLE